MVFVTHGYFAPRFPALRGRSEYRIRITLSNPPFCCMPRPV